MHNSLQVLFVAFDVAFDFWPVYLAAPLGWRKKGNTVLMMLGMWVFWALVRIALALYPQPTASSLVIPEPWSTILFFIAGAVLGGALVAQVLFKRQRLLRKAERAHTREALLHLSPVEFEEMVVELFRGMGHQAKRTGRSGDHGVDVVVKTKKGAKWIVQCKRWRRPVGESVIRDFYGTLQHEKASGGVVIAVSGFSKAAQAWAKGKPIRLISGDEFIKTWKRVMKGGRK